jgi:hypothetical protein
MRCESIERHRAAAAPALSVVQLFLQTVYYFSELPLSPFKEIRTWATGLFSKKQDVRQAQRRRIQEQYGPWGEDHTKRFDAALAGLELISPEKVTYPTCFCTLRFSIMRRSGSVSV